MIADSMNDGYFIYGLNYVWLEYLPGSLTRIAIPIAADRTIAMQLVNDTGFDAFYTGSIADSWRQQPGAPIYCTDLKLNEMQAVIDTAERERLPTRRELALAAIQ